MARSCIARSCRLTDYFALLQVGGQWKIANKAWTRNPKPAMP